MNLIPDQTGLILQLARFFVVLVAGLAITRGIIMPLMFRSLSSRADKKTAETMQNVAGVVGFLFAFVVALQAGNFGNLVTIVGAIAAALTVAVGFGMRDQVNNLVGGIFIHLDPPFLRGDYVSVTDYEGIIKEIKLRHTVLNGVSAEKIVVPNSIMSLNPVRNYTKDDKTKLIIKGVSKPEKLSDTVSVFLEAAKEHDKVLSKPEPEIVHTDVGEEVAFELQCWTKQAQQARKIRGQVIASVIENGMEAQLFEEPPDEDASSEE